MFFTVFDVMDNVFPIFFMAMFCLVFGLIIYTFVKGVKEKRADDAAPVLTVAAIVKGKRIAVHHSTHQQSVDGTPLMASTSDTTYYATFEVESGDRMELQLTSRQYAELAEGDRGKLTFQRKRFHRFDRDRTEK